jgi:predicted metalloprotease
MRLDQERPSENIEDRRGRGGFGRGGFGRGFGFPRGGRQITVPMGGRGGFGLSTLIILVLIYLAAKFLFGIDLLEMFTGGGMRGPGSQTETEYTVPGGSTDVADPGDTGGGVTTNDVTTDAGKDFVSRVVGSTERVWGEIFQKMGRQYQEPKLVLFSDYVQSTCGMAQSAMGPFYCPLDQKVYIDLSFYQDMKSRLSAPGDFAQAYVIAHEVGHHVQNLFGIAEKVTQARMQMSPEEGNVLSVRMELQADCFAGIWAKEANATANILEQGDIEEGLNAAAAIGDDRLQKRSQGYVVPDAFTHGTSEQRVRWFRKGLEASDLRDCDAFGTNEL